MVVVVKGANTLLSCRYCQGEHTEIYWKVIEIKQIHKHTKMKSPSTLIPLEHLNYSRKCVSISSVAKSIRLKAVPLVLVGYYHLIYMPTFETNHFSSKWRAQPINHAKWNIYTMWLMKGYNSQFGYNLRARIGFRGSWLTKKHINSFCHLTSFLTNNYAGSRSLHRIRTAGIKIHLYPQVLLKTIKMLQI